MSTADLMGTGAAVKYVGLAKRQGRPLSIAERKCACGGSAGLVGSCSACEKKKLLGQPLQTKLRINEPGDQYEKEADRAAEEVMRITEPARHEDNSKAVAAPLVQGKVNANSAAISTAPPIVHDVLSSPGQPLDAATRAFFEPRFGHKFSQVRLHTDARAAESAEAVNARAFTVGHDIVMGTGQFVPSTLAGQRLLAHELDHVVQQSAAAPAAGSRGFLQRSGLEYPSTTEGQMVFGATPTPNLAAGLPEPDCSTRVSDVFQLGAVNCPQRPECCFAQIHDRKDPERNGIFRADYLIEGKPDCEYGDQKSHDYWLHLGSNQWRIVEIDSTTRVTVMNNCGEEEVLGTQEGGATNQSAPLPDTGDARVLKPSDENSQGRLKNTHEIRWDENCDRVTLTPIDNSKPSKVYVWDSSINEFVNEMDRSDTQTPGQLERLVGITTKVHEDGKWQGTRCGELPRFAL